MLIRRAVLTFLGISFELPRRVCEDGAELQPAIGELIEVRDGTTVCRPVAELIPHPRLALVAQNVRHHARAGARRVIPPLSAYLVPFFVGNPSVGLSARRQLSIYTDLIENDPRRKMFLAGTFFRTAALQQPLRFRLN